ncbi:FUSC family protein [Burkholderia cenocepacia]|uniref:FUSC family protein n=1 Tax=Burkholderia cenocepacia TaxID=95486 RepID=UPI00285519BB|nr:FUSC family protein [Burkholderia cenocepacia]ELK7719622.1 FUSC family protein [Burkholderia cenocepacia]MDR8030457.1 FUSC family protein [Burkholderia cenocepacia]MDR8041405.1 FUSC family protein [Burkholderia cenocepacia]
MAQPAADVRSPGPREVLRLLAPFPGRAAIAVRVALICALTAFVTAAYGTPEAALSAYVVFFMIRADRVTSVVLAAALLLIVTIVIGLVLGIAIFSIDYSILRVACMAVLSVALLYLTSASKLRPVGAILAMIVGFGLDQLGLAPFGEAATRALLYIWLTIAIPVGVAIVVNLLIAPSPRKLAHAQLAKRLRLAARRLRGDDDARAAFDASLREGDKQLLTWLKLSKLEGSSSAADFAALRQAIVSSTALMVGVALADREPDARLPDAFATPIAATLDDMAAILERGGYPVDVTLALPPADTLPPLARIAATDLEDAITHFAEPGATAPTTPTADATAEASANATPAAAAATPEAPAAAPAPAPRGGFFLPDARTNPDHIRYALKTTAAAIFCYLLYSQLDWSGIHTCVVTCYIVSLGSTAETVEKLTLRIFGCIIGALLGTAALVFVVPALSSVGHLMALVFAGAWLSAWIAFGSPRIAYAGFQVAFAFFLCVIQGAGPGFDLTIARDRTIGILLGNVVVYLVFTRIWPVSIGKQIDVAFAALLDQWRRIAQIAQPAERRALAAEAFARHGAISQELGLVHYEPSWVRPAATWLATRRRALAELGAIEGPLFLLAERRPGDAAIGARLSRVAEPGNGDTVPSTPSAAPPSSAAPTDPARDALLNLIDTRLAQIADAARQATPKEPAPHAPT